MTLSKFPSSRAFPTTLAASALLALSACGGSSGDGPSTQAPPPAPTVGTVGFLFTDAPTDDFCQVLATVQSIDLLGDAGTTNVYTGPETIDVLALRNYADLFAIDTAVPVGTYSKIRLTLSDLALVGKTDTGCAEEADWEHPKLPGNGKLDLNPRGDFQVVGGETLLIEIDLDMEKSLHAHQTGNGKWQFRPVVFVTIAPDDTKLVRVFGQVRDKQQGSFELCPVEPASSTDDDDDMPPANGMGGDDDSGECLDVFAGAGTGIFDETGAPVGYDAFADGELLTAIGFLRAHDDDDDADDRMDDLRLDAEVLELGPQGTFLRIQGAVVSAPGGNDLFVFDPVDGSDPTSPIDVLYQAGTKIFALGSNEALTTAALQPGVPGEVDGVFTDPATSGEPLKASLVVLDVDATPAIALIERTIESKSGSGTLTLVALDPQAAYDCVKTDADTRFLQITETANSSETADIDFGALAAGDVVDVYGEQDPVDAGCVIADAVQKYVPATP